PPPPSPPVPPGPAAELPAPPPGSPGSAPTRRPTFHGTGGTLFGIHVVNVLLTIATLGFYYFWAKTRVRAFLLSQTAIEGDRFAYHGIARELLLGTLKAALVFGLPIFLLNIVRDKLDVPASVQVIAGVLSGSLFFVFFPIAMVGARRYRLSRTSWRGIRFSFRGRVWELIKIFILGTFLTGITLGFYYPFFLVTRQAFMVSHSYFGSERFDFTGRGRELFGPYLVAILLTLPTLGLYWVWYVAWKRRYFWDHTVFGSARFSCSVTGGALLGLWVVNVLLLVCTLGLAWPWVRVRNILFSFRNLALVGPLDLARIQQQAQQVGSIGEGLSGFFDSGFDLA
ncbi:MAG TPA: DUF898 family protein, partial [Methylomirabilota bacterium]|nr:DUF898 family protein [Methylomirabilota bacterium]